MLNMRTRERLPAPAGADPATVSIEAGTIEEALARLTEQWGPRARILSADRVRRGGIAGFFAREMVELVAEVGPISEAVASPPLEVAAVPVSDGLASGGVAGAFAHLLEQAEKDDSPPKVLPVAEAGTAMARRVHPEADPPPAVENDAAGRARIRLEGLPAAVETEPASRVISQPLPAPSPPPGHGVDWDAAGLLELGLPDRLLRAVARLEPTDDIAHLAALADAIAPVCGSLPPGPAHLVGRRVERLRNAVGISEDRSGHLHLVVGDDDLPEVLSKAPAVVSWVTERGAAKAVAIALGTGARLGYGMSSAFGSAARRVTPVDAAIAIRELMERT